MEISARPGVGHAFIMQLLSPYDFLHTDAKGTISKLFQISRWGGPCGDNDLSIVKGNYSWKSAQTLFSKTIGRSVSDPPGKSVLMVLKIIK